MDIKSIVTNSNTKAYLVELARLGCSEAEFNSLKAVALSIQKLYTHDYISANQEDSMNQRLQTDLKKRIEILKTRCYESKEPAD